MPATATTNTELQGLKQGDARWFFGMLAIMKATSAETNGEFSLLEIIAPAGLEAPLHVHHNEDEGFLVLEGSVTLYIGDEVIEATAGQHAFGPREVPHRFTIGPEGARMIWVLTPGGFENMVEAVSVPAEAMTPPPEGVYPPENAGELIKPYGNELLV